MEDWSIEPGSRTPTGAINAPHDYQAGREVTEAKH